jgi:hypothetical protein
MKAKLCLGLVAAAFVAPAWALSPDVTNGISQQFQIFMAGATAQKNTLPNLLGGAPAQQGFPIYPGICKSGTLDIFYDPKTSTLSAGSNYRAYSCTLEAANNLPAAFQPYANQNIVIHYRLLSGSWIGVGPLSRAQSVTRMQIDSTSCTTTGGTAVPAKPLSLIYNKPSYICSGTTTAVPDIGVSDQEPSIFFGQNAPNDGNSGGDPTQVGITAADLANITTAPLQGVIMNIIASKKLINALQLKQGLPSTDPTLAVVDQDRPNLTSPQVTSLLTANGGPYNTDWSPLLGDAGQGFNVNVCRRISAVGTQIAANAFWLNYPCAGSSALVPAVPTDSTGSYNVTENNLIADLRVCVANYNENSNTADNYAIGLLFTDNNPSTESFHWDFLKIDGSDPSVHNAITGAYRFVTVETWQYRTKTVNGIAPLTAPANSQKLGFSKALFAELQKPTITSVQPGFLSLAEVVPANTTGPNIWPMSVTTSGGPHICTPPIIYF